MPNKELAEKVRDQIVDHPETHNQERWMHRIEQDSGSYCQTTGCAAGWAVVLGDPSAKPVFRGLDSSSVVLPDGTGRGYSEYAAELLGIDDDLAEYLFNVHRTVDEVLDVLNVIIDGGEPTVPPWYEDYDDYADDDDDDPDVDADWGIPEVEHQGLMD